MENVFISVEEAKKRLIAEEAIFVDCRHQLSDPEQGYRDYLVKHIAGARFAHLDQDLSGQIQDTTGRHPLPSLSQFTDYLREKHIDPEQIIICYDDLGGGIAARMWWMLRQVGYAQVRILEGGWPAWEESSAPQRSGEESFDTIDLELKIDEWKEGRDPVYYIEDIGSSVHLIDSRAPERYEGVEEPWDEIAGRIPGSVNLYWQSHLDENMRLKEREQIRMVIEEAESKDLPNVYYCGSGVTACFNLAIREELGLTSAGIYPGSYSEFSRRHPDRIVRE